MKRPLTQEQLEIKKYWEQITETLARRQGPLEEPPRILNFNELLNLENQFVWVETFEPNEIKACQVYGINALHDKNTVSIFADGYYSLLRKNYGKKYQCWTAKPEVKNATN